MMKKIKKGIVDLGKLFADFRFVIPNYQRSYSWKKGNSEVLIKDFLKNEDYFIGNIIIQKYDPIKYEIIDGQQRLTTCYLILMALKNKNLLTGERNKKSLEKIIGSDSNDLRINNENVLDDVSSKVLNYIFENSDIPEAIKNHPIVKMYSLIVKKISALSKNEKETLFKNLKNSTILYIDTSESKITSYQLFLNLNTKGLKLSNMDIIKSHLFNLCCKNSNFKTIKCNWYDAISGIEEGDYDDYLSIYANLITSNQFKTKKTEITQQIIENISDTNNALESLKIIGNKKSSFYCAYRAITYSNCENDYISFYSDNNVYIKSLFGYLSFVKKIGFIQFNIALIALLSFSNNEQRKKIEKNLTIINDFIQFIFLYSVKKMLDRESPSIYGNKFVSFAASAYQNKTDIPKHIGTIVKSFGNLNDIKENDLGNLDVREFAQNSKMLQIAVALISYLDGDTEVNFGKGEHFIPDSDVANPKHCFFANIIPVSKDDYGAVNQASKLILYQASKTSEPHIKIFVEKDVDLATSTAKLDDRQKRYKKLFVKKYNELKNKLVALAPASEQI